nr:carotenoid 1,2-hydratase [Prosthecomicrobium hirschii]
MDFDHPVAPGGYAWWYLDGVSDDGASAITVIGFVGSVFSPYYAFARRRGAADPETHVAINVALYGRGAAWAMTERGRGALRRSPDLLEVGPSRMRREGRQLIVEIDEIAVPWPRRLRGTIRLDLPALGTDDYALDEDARHVWRPIAPVARIEVAFEQPRLAWCGNAYLDHNRGTEPIEAGFRSWSWARLTNPAGTTVCYAVEGRREGPRGFALAFPPAGPPVPGPLPPFVALKPTLWRIARPVASEDASSTRILKTLEDAPFYARSLVAATIGGEPAVGIHESLSLDRFRRPVVQMMLPFRMPRRA